MSLVNFICPDGGRISVDKCLQQGGCRMGDRCATRPYLMMAKTERPVRAKCIKCGEIYSHPPGSQKFFFKCDYCNGDVEYLPSTTQLIQGTKAAFLKLTTDFSISPDGRAFMITGTKGHSALESFEDELSFVEEKFEDANETGIADVLTVEDGETILSDYKVSGSYKVAKALGFVTVAEPIDGEFFKSGPRKGEQKTRKVVRRILKEIDRFEWALQLNKYRIEYEKRGFKVDKMKIQCVVRDGNTYIARQRGVFRNVYYFDIERLDDQFVLDYFAKKKKDLLLALKIGRWDPICSNLECWDGLKCASYCECAASCPQGKYLMREKLKEGDTMPIKGLSETRRLPRMGKLRLGVMVESPGKNSYPKEVKHFILDPAVANPEEHKKLIDIFESKYGKEPTSIDIMFPVADLEHIFPQYYKSYGSGSLMKCKGDGSKAETNDQEYMSKLKNIGDGDFGKIVECAGKNCPYYMSKKCSEVATLSVLLPELPGSGVWQVSTGSIHSILNLNSCFDYIRALAGRFHMIPLRLERREQAISHDGKKTKHYVLHINLELSLKDLQNRAMIDPVKSAMELPPIADEAKDLYLEHNETINPETPPIEPEVVDSESPPPQPLPDQLGNNDGTDPGPNQKAQKTTQPAGWDDDPTPEQAELAMQIEAAIKECETTVILNGVKGHFEPHFRKDSKDLTGKQRQDLNETFKKHAAVLIEDKK